MTKQGLFSGMFFLSPQGLKNPAVSTHDASWGNSGYILLKTVKTNFGR